MASQGSAGAIHHVAQVRRAEPRFLHIWTAGSNPLEHRVVDVNRRIGICIATVSPDGKPDMRIERLSGADYRSPPPSHWRVQQILVSEVFFNKSRGTIDLEFDSFAVFLRSAGHLTRSFTFHSSMGPLTWQHDGLFKQDLQLLTARKETVAVIRDAKLPRGNVMVIGIVAGDIAPQGIFEEILFSALAVLEWRRRVGCVGGLGMVDAKRMTRSLVAAVAGFPGRLLKGKARKKKEGEAGRRTRAETGNETGRMT